MLIKVDRSNGYCEVLDANCTMGGELKIETHTPIKDVLAGLCVFAVPTICLRGTDFSFLYLPASYTGEVYYSCNSTDVYIGNDYYQICSLCNTLSLDEKAAEAFMEYNSRTPEEHTWVNEVKKCIPRSVYTVAFGDLYRHEMAFKELNIHTRKEEYEEYKRNLEKEVLSTVHGKCGVLLSGGVDSRLIAYILHDHGVSFTAYTVLYRPYLDANISDIERAVRVCKHLNVELKIVECDLASFDINKLNKFIYNMPSTSHLSMSFICLLEAAGKDGIDVLYTGQNADAFYCFGPTTKFSLNFTGMSNVYKRLCLSDLYFKTLDDVNGGNVITKLLLKLPLWMGKLAYEKKKSRKYYYPKSSDELISNFRESASACVILSEQKTSAPLPKEKVSVQDITRKLLSLKICGYTKSGDSEAIRISARMFAQCNVVFPHSGENMLAWYNCHSLCLRDVFMPKYYSYKYSDELAEKYGKELSDFDFELTDVIRKKYKETIHSLESFYKELLENSTLGKELEKIPEETEVHLNSYAERFGFKLASYWKWKIINELNIK